AWYVKNRSTLVGFRCADQDSYIRGQVNRTLRGDRDRGRNGTLLARKSIRVDADLYGRRRGPRRLGQCDARRGREREIGSPAAWIGNRECLGGRAPVAERAAKHDILDRCLQAPFLVNGACVKN